jgi:drug/metabolite transporter, DME family
MSSNRGEAAGDANSRDPHYRRGVLLVLGAGLLWSLTGLFIRYIETAGAWQIVLMRSGSLGGFILLYLIFRYRGATLDQFRRIGLNGVLAGIFVGVSITGLVFAMTETTVANAMFILAGAPFAAAGLAWLIMGERVSLAVVVAMIIVVAGIGIMVGDGIRAGFLLGNLLAVMTMLGYAAYVVFLRRGRGQDMLPALCLGAFLAAAVAAIFADGFAVTGQDIWLSCLMGGGLIGVGLIFFTAGSRHLLAAELIFFALIEIVLAPVWVWAGLGEVPRDLTLAGGGVVLAAIVGQALLGRRR